MTIHDVVRRLLGDKADGWHLILRHPADDPHGQFCAALARDDGSGEWCCVPAGDHEAMREALAEVARRIKEGGD